MKQKRRLQTGVLLVLLGILAFVWFQQQALADWFKLRGYTPPAAVVQLATDNGMTEKARHLFYVNKPLITAGSSFSQKCPEGGEKTVVLGCYVGNDDGIYLYDVTDERLNGVEQVTAAHEMLHAAYRRLSTGEKKKVDTWLQAYYKDGLTDQRVKETIDSYKISEPNDVVNEMHSIFATEIADLPPELEAYYTQYFTDRSKIIAFMNQYRAEFTTRQDQITAYDTQLADLKTKIDANKATLERQVAALEAQEKLMNDARSRGNIATYNANVDSYNAALAAYKVLAQTTKDQIAQYNDIVTKRNAVVVEEQQLVNAITNSPSTVPVAE